MFETLLSKVMLILAISLCVTTLGSLIIINFFKEAYKQGKEFVTCIQNKYGQNDLVLAPSVFKSFLFPILILNIIIFIALLFCKTLVPFNFILMFLFSLTTGGLIGLSLIAVDENLGLKVTSLTAIATLITALVGMYSGIDFSFLGKFLFFALLGLIIVSFIRIFFTIKGISKKIIAFIGIAIFIGYLLLDFNNLNKAGKLSTINNWVTALDYSVNIYLDIINLFLYILDAMSD